jgi:hypothetical protein
MTRPGSFHRQRGLGAGLGTDDQLIFMREPDVRDPLIPAVDQHVRQKNPNG